MHDYDLRVARPRLLEPRPRLIDLAGRKVPDYRYVARVERQRPRRHPVRCVQPNEVRPIDLEGGLEISRDVPTVICINLCFVADADRRVPPRNVVVPGNRNHRAKLPRVSQKYRRTLEFPSPGPLREITRCCNRVERTFGNCPLYRVDLLQHRRLPEM